MCFFFKNKGLILLVIVYNLDTHYFKLGGTIQKKVQVYMHHIKFH